PLQRELATDRLADRLGQLAAKLDRVADRLAARRKVRERNRRLAVSDRERVRRAHLCQRSGQLDRAVLGLRARRARQQQRCQQDAAHIRRPPPHRLRWRAHWREPPPAAAARPPTWRPPPWRWNCRLRWSPNGPCRG